MDKNQIDAFRKGNHEVFGRILSHSLEPCLKLAIRLVGSRQDAEDIVQDCFIRIWEKRRTVKNAESFDGWLRRIVINRCYDYLRREKRKVRYIDETRSVEKNNYGGRDEADRGINISDSNGILEIIVGRLSPKQRIVFILSEIEEMSIKEIEKITGMTGYSIKSNCYHARKKAKEIYYSIERR